MTKNICTVLLITYNHQKYIRQSIDSVLQQKTKYPFIIKIFDDASTDGSSDIIREYANKYPGKIEAHIAKKNRGAQTNIWNAYKSVDTKYCCLLETDDYWCDDTKLEQQISALEEHPECSFCAHQTLVHNVNDKYRSDEDGFKSVTNDFVLKSDVVSLSHIKHQPVGSGYIPFIGSRLIRMSLVDLDAIKHKEAFLFDNSQFYYMLLKGDMYFINKVMSVYNQTGSGVCSGTNPYNRISAYIDALMDFNKETNGVIQERIFLEIHFYISYNFWLLHKQSTAPTKPIYLHGYFLGLPIFKLLDNANNVRFRKLWGLVNLVYNPNKMKLALAGVPVLDIERRFQNVRKNGIVKHLCNIFKRTGTKIQSSLLLRREKRKKTDSSLLILDNFEPSWLLTGFRVTEFNYLLNNIPQSRLLTFSEDVFNYSDWKYRSSVGDINWNFPMSIRKYNKYKRKYISHFDLQDSQLLYMCADLKYNARGAYCMFIYNAYLSYKFLEQNNIPFVFTLFPGGGFRLNHSFSDHMLKSVFASPMFRGVYAPQKVIVDYLVGKKLCPKEKIFFSYGGGFFQFTKRDVLPHKNYKTDKPTLDICFIAYKYMDKGLDKGFDLFVYAAREIIKKYPFVHFHNVGTHTLDDFNDDFSDIQDNFHMYGSKTPDFFPEFFSKMDIALSPNRPNVLDQGAFDGFPLCVEPMFFGVPLFCTDELGLNYNYVPDKELVIVKPDVADIVSAIEFYIKHPKKLQDVGRAGQIKAQKYFDRKYQEEQRRKFIKKYLKI